MNSFFQPKYSINQPNDIYEQEADVMADRVIQSPQVAKSFFQPKTSIENGLQRKCAHCEEEEKLQLKEAGGNHSIGEYTSDVAEVINSNGQSLDGSTRGFMEPKFGYDFSKVQIHSDAKANESSKAVNAKAYTHQNHIVFASGQYQPETLEGKRLLAHELTHVVQQGNAQSPAIQRACADKSVKSSAWVSVKNQHDFAALDGYTPIKGKAHDVYFDGKHYFFCFNDKRIYFKYVKTEDGVIPDFEAAYNIKLENDGAKWLKKEVILLSEALSMLNDTEAAQLRGYRFIKQGGVMLTDDNKVVAGLTTQDIVNNEYKIEFWKFCFDGTSDTEVKHKPGISQGVSCILHEIGHALMASRRRPYMEAMYFKSKYQKEYDKASPEVKKGMNPKLDELTAREKEAETTDKKQARVETEFLKLVKGKKALTPYSEKNVREAFAEAFSIFKVNPGLLEKTNPKLHEYFVNSSFK
ncbi:eCIS core domain-containing protein [Solitalea longa]|uniref:eCIS core domain-containing protein n=1 Tax=Solitalea longa TaxID=2079460 RepID=UPI0013FDD192|nr:DUF4157 domain-containing protein [Solitalea longa]